MADKAGVYSPYMNQIAQRFADARRAGASTQEPLYGQSPQTDVDAEMRSRMAQATSDGQGPAMGQRFADVMNPPPVKPGNYVWSDLNNLGAGGEQYHYNVTYDGTVQFRSPISGKMITLKPSDTAPHKKKAYEAIMKQIAQAQKVSS